MEVVNASTAKRYYRRGFFVTVLALDFVHLTKPRTLTFSKRDFHMTNDVGKIFALKKAEYLQSLGPAWAKARVTYIVIDCQEKMLGGIAF